jgi:hypothetical protein
VCACARTGSHAFLNDEKAVKCWLFIMVEEKNEQKAKACLFVFERLEGYFPNSESLAARFSGRTNQHSYIGIKQAGRNSGEARRKKKAAPEGAA